MMGCNLDVLASKGSMSESVVLFKSIAQDRAAEGNSNQRLQQLDSWRHPDALA